MQLPFMKTFRARKQAAREIKRAQEAIKRFGEIYIAKQPVDLARLGEFRADAFPESGPCCWLDRPDALLEIERRAQAGEITAAQAEICVKWVIDGYYVAKGLISQDKIDKVWNAYENAVAERVIQPNAESLGAEDVLPGRVLDPHLLSWEVKELQCDKKILEITDLLFGRKTLPFQTIMGHKGSQQAAHSDSIHMTTYPLGWLIANWIALEDIHPDSGPLEFYPRSHRLVPPLYSGDLGIPPYEFKISNGGVYAARYEPVIRDFLAKMELKPEVFLAKAGDVLFWHSGLIHGGSTRNDLKLSRKALVCHYFAEGVVTYHDLSGNPSRLHRNGFSEPPTAD